jgi:hypothetical protein
MPKFGKITVAQAKAAVAKRRADKRKQKKAAATNDHRQKQTSA